MTDDTSAGTASSLGRINIETNAKLEVDVPATEIVISDKTEAADIIISKPVDKIVNEGSSTRLSINNNVGSVISKGDELALKVTAGSTIKAIDMSGNKSSIEVALGSKVEDIVVKGNDAAITGRGNVSSVKVEGNNSKIDTANTKVTVDSNVTGTTMNGKELKAGTSTTTENQVPVGGGGQGYYPSYPTQPVISGSAITINNPGLVKAGIPVQMTAADTDVTWEVYNYIDESWGYAEITEQGLLTPIGTGVVRVVATSRKNRGSYGAVDITITGKKFVRMEPIAPIELTTDEGMYTVDDLISSGKLPTKVNLVYETGNGTETETIEVELERAYWFNYNYDGALVGNYFLCHYISVPRGYERPADFYACVEVKVRVPQTGSYLFVKTIEPIETLTLTRNEGCVKIGDLMDKYYYGKKVTLHLSDNSTAEAVINGYYNYSGNMYNGAIKGTYIVDFSADTPNGILNRTYYSNSSNSINWYENKSIIIPAKIVVEANQSYNSVNDGQQEVPDTTQPRFTSSVASAAIHAVNLTGLPTSLSAGDTIDLTQYLSVETDSPLDSDKQVYWTVNRVKDWDRLDSINGKLIPDNSNSVTIRAISVIDATKYAEVTIPVNITKQISSFTPFEPINVNTDLKINDFSSMYKALEQQLPTTITGVSETGETVIARINGWFLGSFEGGTMVLYPQIKLPDGYNGPVGGSPTLSVNITVPQTDNRVVVTTGSANEPTIKFAEDKYATTSSKVLGALYHSTNGEYSMPVRVMLEDGSETVLQCGIFGWSISSEDKTKKFYKGLSGQYTLHCYVLLPEGYKVLNPSSNYDFEVTQELIVTVDQNPSNDELFVTSEPTKLNYHVGEYLDLSGLVVRKKDTSIIETSSFYYLGPGQLAEAGLELQWEDGTPVDINEPIPLSMNGKVIFIKDPVRYEDTFFGPIFITE